MTHANPQRVRQLEQAARSAAHLLAVLADRRSSVVVADSKQILRDELDQLGVLAPYLHRGQLRVPEPEHAPDYYTRSSGGGDQEPTHHMGLPGLWV